jgi:hypothetical protein
MAASKTGKNKKRPSPNSPINSEPCHPLWECYDPSENAEALKAQFFLLMPDADFSDIPNASYPAEMPSPMSISEEEIASVINKSHPFKAAGSDGIPFFVLKRL